MTNRDTLLAHTLSTNMVILLTLLQMPGQFSFAVTLMNVLLVLSQTEFSQSLIHSGVMQHLWMQLLPPVVPEIADQVNSAIVSMFLFTWRLLSYKGKGIPLQAWTGHEGSMRLRLPDFKTMKAVRLSALHTGRLYPPGNIPGTHFWGRPSRPQGHSVARRIMSLKNSSDIIGNRTLEPMTFQLIAQCLRPLSHFASANLYLE